MKAMIFTKFGSPDVLQLQEVEKPGPKDDEVLVKVYAASVNALDRHLLKSKPFQIRLLTGNGLLKPKDQRIGVDIAGRVEAVGKNVTRFQPGDEVFGIATGAFAEYACADEDELALKPANSSFEEAAAVPIGAITALQGMRDKGLIQAGQKVLIQGATGAVGTFAVQLARSLGAEVTAVCSTRNVEMVRSIGAEQVIDYTQEDVTRKGQQYDLILAINGYHSIFAYRRILRPEGTYVLVGEGSNTHLFRGILQIMLLGPLMARTSKQNMRFFIAKVTSTDLDFVKGLMEDGKVVPVIDRCYPLCETADAFRYLEKGHARGKVVITVEQNDANRQGLNQHSVGAQS